MHPVNILVISVVFICLMVGQGSQAGWPSVIINRINAGRSAHNSSLPAWSRSKCQSVGLWMHMSMCVRAHVGLHLNLFTSLSTEINQPSIPIWIYLQMDIILYVITPVQSSCARCCHQRCQFQVFFFFCKQHDDEDVWNVSIEDTHNAAIYKSFYCRFCWHLFTVHSNIHYFRSTNWQQQS